MLLEPGTPVLEGRFKVISHLGTGGMGEVYVGEQVSLGRQVALKVLKQDIGTQPNMSERFAREAKLLSAVDHPAVVRIIDFGRTDNSICLVMELVDGVSLFDELKNGPILPDRAISILTQLAEGLAAIHEKGIVHRDLHPRNVLLTKSPFGEKARLLDFGIARLIEADSSPALSMVGVVLGVPEYLSPEQARGVQVTLQSDIYAFGVLAYQVLSGELPHKGPTPKDVLKAHLTQQAKPLEIVAPHLVDQRKLCELVMKCLEKDPALRPENAKVLAAKFAALPQVGEPTLLSESNFTVVNPHESGVSVGGAALDRDLARTVIVQPDSPVAVHSFPAGKPNALSNVMKVLPVKQLVGLLTLVLVVVIALVVGIRSKPSPVADIRALLHPVKDRQLSIDNAKQALVLLESAQKDKTIEGKTYRVLKAIALHRSIKEFDKHREEFGVWDNLGVQEPEWNDELVLSAVVEHYAFREALDWLKKLQSLDQAAIRPKLNGFLGTPPAIRAWGTLRYLDQAKALSADERVKRYAELLSVDECGIRGRAAKRLGEIGDAKAETALNQLKDSARKPDGSNCGHDEAALALRSLNKP